MNTTTQYYMYCTVSAGEYDYAPCEAIIEFDITDGVVGFFRVIDETTGEQIRDNVGVCLNPHDPCIMHKYTEEIESFILANKKDWRE